MERQRIARNYYGNMIPTEMERQIIAYVYYGDKMEVPNFEDLEKGFEHRRIDRDIYSGAIDIWEKYFAVPNFNRNTKKKIDPRIGDWLKMKFKIELCEDSDTIQIYQGYSMMKDEQCYEEMVSKNIQIEPAQAKELKEFQISSYLFEDYYEPDYSPAKPDYKPASDYSPGRSV